MSLKSRLYELLYEVPCRAYARRFVGDKPADAFYRLLCGFHFWRVHRYLPRFKNPRTFSEKVFHRMLFNRDPRWTYLSDKWHAREYVADKVGMEYLIPLLWKGEDADEIPFDKLPSSFVVKTNHGCKTNIIVTRKEELSVEEAKLVLKKWLRLNYCEEKFLGVEWAYKNIKPMIIVEELLNDKGNVPVDYKFFCYSGQAKFLQVSYDRFGDASERLVDRDFRPLDLWNGLKLYNGDMVPPKNYEDMVRLAEALARGFDFIRVDLYNISGRIYVGELTCYPAAGCAKFIPRQYDFIFGEHWTQFHDHECGSLAVSCREL